MRLSPIVSAFILSFSLAACGASGTGDDVVSVDARTIDGSGGAIDALAGSIDAPTGGANALGNVCSQTVACPAGNMCTGVQGVGSQTMGWCTPPCTETGGQCAAGYTGPAGGMPVCALRQAAGAPPTQCAIICTAPAQCPMDLACTPVPGQMPPVSIRAPPA
jgi:hypothetical protein